MLKNKTTIKTPISYDEKLKSSRENGFTLNSERENVNLKSESITVNVPVKYAGTLKPNVKK